MRNGVDSQSKGHLVEIDIAGLNDGPLEVDNSVATFSPAAVRPAAETVEPSTSERLFGSNDALFQPCNRGDELEDRTRRVLPLDGFVL